MCYTCTPTFTIELMNCRFSRWIIARLHSAIGRTYFMNQTNLSIYNHTYAHRYVYYCCQSFLWTYSGRFKWRKSKQIFNKCRVFLTRGELNSARLHFPNGKLWWSIPMSTIVNWIKLCSTAPWYLFSSDGIDFHSNNLDPLVSR